MRTLKMKCWKLTALLCAGLCGAGATAFGQHPSWMKPDFIVTSVELDPASPASGGAFTATVTVLNQGDIPGDAGQVRMWVSKAGNAKVGDAGDAEQAAGILEVGESAVLTFALTAATESGTHHARAFVDADGLTAEKSEGNNQKSATYTLHAPPTWMKPDFVVDSLTLDPAVPAAGGAFTATVTVRNQGDIPGDAGVVRMWVSQAGNAKVGDEGDAEQAAGTLAVGESRTLVFALTAATKKGTHHARAFVDATDVTAEKSEGNNQKSATYTLHQNAPAPAVIQLLDLEQVYDGTPRSVSVVTDPASVPVRVAYAPGQARQALADAEGAEESEDPPVAAGSYAVTATVADPDFAGSASDTLVVLPAEAKVVLGDLEQTYDGQPKPVSVTTDPEGLKVSVIYQTVEPPAYPGGLSVVHPSEDPPVEPGSYPVTAHVEDPNYYGKAGGTLVIAKKAPATVKLYDLEQTYDGGPKEVAVKTDPPELKVAVTYDGGEKLPVDAGTFKVVATVADPKYEGSASDALVISKAAATVTLGGLSQTYDGAPKSATVSTDPAGLAVEITYNGSADAPVNAGSYAVAASVVDANYAGSANGTLGVAKAGQAIAFAAIDNQLATNVVALSATASSGLPVSFAVASGPAAISEGATLTFTGAGTVGIAASQAGDDNWNAATEVVRTFDVEGPKPNPELSAAAVNVREAGEGRFYVRLDRAPTGSVAVAVGRSAGNTNLWVKNGAARTFTPANWSTWQVVTLAANADGDSLNETATFQVSAPDVADQYVEATALDIDIGENVALASGGSVIAGTQATKLEWLIDGVHDSSANYGYTTWTNLADPGTMTLDLRDTTTVRRIRLLNWDWGYRVHQYRIESSLDGTNWSALVDASAGEHRGWEDWAVDEASARYLRFTGLSNSANRYVCIAEWEVYGWRGPLPRPEVSGAAVNVREAGEGRFFVRLDRAPDVNVSVDVSRSAGNTNLSLQSGAALTFTPADWDEWQAVTLAAPADGNGDDETATFQISSPGVEDRFVEATALDIDIGENLALSGSAISGGADAANLIDGVHAASANQGSVIWTSVPPEAMTLDLQELATVTRIRLLNWDWAFRTHGYRIESSVDGADWSVLVDASAGGRSGWEDLEGAAAPVRYLRFTGLSNTADSAVSIAEWEVYGTRGTAPRPEVSKAAVNVREAGEGRFYVRLDRAPAADVAVAVARRAGSADLGVQAGAALTFTPANWSAWQLVTLAANEDEDADEETALFRVAAPGVADRFVEATALDIDIGENRALASLGSTISGTFAFSPERAIDGVHTSSVNYGYPVWTNVPPGTLTLDLKAATALARIRLLNWDWGYRVHQYRIESSLDGAAWSPLVDASAGGHTGWEDWAVEGQSARYLRFTALSNSANRYVCIAEWEVYAARTPTQHVEFATWPEFPATNVNVREAGEGRFYVRLNSAPEGNVSVGVSHGAGDANIFVQNGASLTFNPANWSAWQAVTLAANADANSDNETATFRIFSPGMEDRFMAATALDDDIGENLALSSRGSTIAGTQAFSPERAINGVHTSSTNYGYVVWTNQTSPGTMTLDLKAATAVARIRLLNWDWGYRTHQYRIESSLDGVAWSNLVDASAGEHIGWEDWGLAGPSARYLRFTGLSNSANRFVCIAQWEVYGEQAQLSQPELSATNVNVREAGEGRFHVRLDSAPAGSVAVAVSRSAGDANLSVKSGGVLTFTPANWSAWQTVTLQAGEDVTSANETATFRISSPGMADGYVTATALDDDIGPNLALASSGSEITGTLAFSPDRTIDGVHASNANYGYTVWTNLADPGTMTLDLKAATAVSRIRLLNWDWSFRTHQYRIESSLDGAIWSPLVDASAGGHSGWEDWAVANQWARYLRFTGLSNSANRYVCIAEWEVYGAARPVPVTSAAEVNVRENGEGRFFVKLDRAPLADTTVRITWGAGASNLVRRSSDTLTFTPANWATWQRVTLAAMDDEDATDGTAIFNVAVLGLAPQIVTARELDDDIGENLALSSGGSTITGGSAPHNLNDGNHTSSWSCGYANWTTVPPEALTLDLKASMTVSRIRLLNWDWSKSQQRYMIESSLDGTTWSLVADASAADRQGWDDWPVANQAIRYLRFTGVSNSVGSVMRVSEWEVYGTRPVARRSLAPAKVESIPSEQGAGAMDAGNFPLTVVTSDDIAPDYESGWAAVDGDPETAWVGQKVGGGYVVVEYEVAFELSTLEVDLAEGAMTDIQYLYSMDAQDWKPLPDDMDVHPVELKYLWLVFPDDGTSAVPNVIEIRPNP